MFIASWVCLRSCADIGSFEVRINDKFGDHPLPRATEWILEYRTIFIFPALFTPLAALATFALNDRSLAGSTLLGLGLLSALEAFFVYEGLRAPLMAVMLGRFA